jgi:two-component system OmpR family sensor kinase
MNVEWVAEPAERERPAERPVDAPPARATAESAEAASPRWRWLPRSLTARLVTGVVALVVIVVMATGTGTYLALRSFLYDRLDQQVASVADSNQNDVAECIGDARFRCGLTGTSGSTLRAPQVEWVIVLDSSGTPAVPVVASRDLMAMNLSGKQRARLVADPLPARSVTTVNGERLRVSGRLIDVNGQHLVVVTGLSTSSVERTLGRLLSLEVVIGASAVVVALVATTLGVRLSLRGLRKVSGTAQEVAAELSPEGAGLERRVPAIEPGTEVGQLAESMNTLLAAVETQFAARLRSEQRMRQFLADASHELRTPLTSIRGFAELARMQRAQGSPDEDNLARIEAEGTRMSRLVDDLLTLARGDQGGEPRREIVEVADLLDDVVATARAAHPLRRIHTEAAPDLAVIGDPDQLRRVVLNLVNNAAVHTRPEGMIDLRATAEGGWAMIRVRDEGPGLPPDEAAQAFERCWRADKARTRARGGTGLGLAIVASIVESHHGGVRFDSSVEAGSTVTVWLPRFDGHAGDAAPE